MTNDADMSRFYSLLIPYIERYGAGHIYWKIRSALSVINAFISLDDETESLESIESISTDSAGNNGAEAIEAIEAISTNSAGNSETMRLNAISTDSAGVSDRAL